MPQIFLRGEGKFGDIFKRMQIIRVDTGLVELATIERRIFIGVRQGPFQPLKLHGMNLVPRGDLDGVQNIF